MARDAEMTEANAARGAGLDADAASPCATRRVALAGAALLALAPRARAASDREPALETFLAGRSAQRGRVSIDAPPLVENGNSAPITVRVDSPMTPADHVTRIAIFNEKNPQPHVAEFRLSPRNGRAEVSTRMRLATTQIITAAAEFSDGSVAVDAFEVIVTIAACTEE